MTPNIDERALAFALCCADDSCQGGWQDNGEELICDFHNSMALRLVGSSELRNALGGPRLA